MYFPYSLCVSLTDREREREPANEKNTSGFDEKETHHEQNTAALQREREREIEREGHDDYGGSWVVRRS
jgi:hypothetical protein